MSAILSFLASLTIKKYKPFVIGITGSVGKTSAKKAIYSVLSTKYEVRESFGSFNNEFGLPITVISSLNPNKLISISRHGEDMNFSLFFKIKVFLEIVLEAFFNLVIKNKNYPQFLVLEYGADKPGDIKKLVSKIRPDLGVITFIGEIPAHVGNYPDADAVLREKAKLIEGFYVSQYAILNGDDSKFQELKKRTRAKILSFGFNKENDIKISSYESKISEEGVPEVNFKLEYGGSFVPVRVRNSIGKPVAYASAVAVASGLSLGMNLVEAIRGLNSFSPEQSRMNILKGINRSLIIDDSYNASLASYLSAIEEIGSIKAARRIGFLGSMLELGKFSEDAHRRVGNLAAKFFDYLFIIGESARFIEDGALGAGFDRRNIKRYLDSDTASQEALSLIKQGDLVLIKGSRGIRMERIVEVLKLDK